MKFKAIISLIVLVLCVFIYVFYFFNHTFSGDPALMAKSKKLVTEYLETNSPEKSFKIKNTYYYDGNYNVNFISKDGTIQGEISIRDEEIYVVNLYNENGEEILHEVK